MDKKQKALIFGSICAMCTYIIFWAIFAETKYNGDLIRGRLFYRKQGNYLGFFVSAAIFFGVFLLAAGIYYWKKKDLSINGMLVCVSLLFIACGVFWSKTEKFLWPEEYSNVYLRTKIPCIYILFLIVLTTLFLNINLKVSKKCRYIWMVLCAGIWAAACFGPNAYGDLLGGLYHYDAYTHSMYRIAEMSAFGLENLSIYGHYALLLLPFIKLMGGANMMNIALLISLIAFITGMCCFLVINKWIKDDMLFGAGCLAFLAVPVMLYLNGSYYQINPHRYFFVAIFLYYISCRKEEKRYEWVGWLIIFLAILWNTETGLVMGLSFAVCNFGIRFVEKRIKFSFLTEPLKLIGVFLAAVAAVDLYNLAVGGNIIGIRTFLYPIGSEEYNIKYLMKPLPKGIQFYIIEQGMFLITICSTLFRVIIERTNISKKTILLFLSAMIGIGSFIYYINRPAYGNISISHISFVIILVLFMDHLRNINKECKQLKIPIFAVGMVIVALSAGTVLYLEKNLETRYNTSWKMDEVRNDIKEIAKEIPKNTYAFGKGIDIIYGELGWKTGCNTIDEPDFNSFGKKMIQEELKYRKDFFVSETGASLFDLSEFKLIEAYVVGEERYLYYRR